MYINSCANISPQNTLDYKKFCEKIIEYDNELLQLLKFDYKKKLRPVEIRRMSKPVKSGIICSDIVLKQANVKNPDAIIVGTGLGLLSDTERFLEKMIYDNEQYLSPTYFIQSTHNTVAAQIALRIKCRNYNFTYVNSGFSFECALLDGIMQLNENKHNILIGSSDEMTKKYFNIIKKTGQWKSGKIKNTKLFNYKTSGALRGEGCVFFILSDKKNQENYAKIKGLEMIYKPFDINEINNCINSFLQKQNIKLSEIDLIILGNNGDNQGDKIYHNLKKNIFFDIPAAFFKHLSGEYQTANSFAFWLGANILKHQKYPDFIMQDKNQKPKKLKNILIYNHYFNIYHSLILLSES